ncbi:glycosyltransferase, partial [bacterium]
MKNLKGKISVIIPAYNEADIICESLRETVRVFKDFGCRYEIIVVDDGSQDATYQKALEEASRHSNVI